MTGTEYPVFRTSLLLDRTIFNCLASDVYLHECFYYILVYFFNKPVSEELSKT